MFDLFFYGTLRDRDVRRLVLGYEIATADIGAGAVDGYRCAPVDGGRFPGLTVSRSDTAPGLAVRNVPMAAAVRTSFFEGETAAYAVRRVPVRLAEGEMLEAWAYVPTAALRLEQGHWSLDRWARVHRARFLRHVRIQMARATPDRLETYRDGWARRL